MVWLKVTSGAGSKKKTKQNVDYVAQEYLEKEREGWGELGDGMERKEGRMYPNQ